MLQLEGTRDDQKIRDNIKGWERGELSGEQMAEIRDLIYTEREMAWRKGKGLRISPKVQNHTTESVGPASTNLLAQIHLALKISEINLQQGTRISTKSFKVQASARDILWVW